MRALYFVGAVFSVVTLWAITLTSPPSDGFVSTTGGGRTVAEKKALAVAFVETQLRENPMIPGLTLSVAYKGDTVIAQGFGLKQADNPKSQVTASTMFQIGSYSKTFIAVGIAKLIDDGKMTWHDPVKSHLPLFKLQDKYAEEYTTLGDLLSMNSVLGAFDGDLAFVFGLFPSERALVEHLAELNTTRSIRSGYAYSNMNFEILGQVIEHATNQTWPAFLRQSIWNPLGMHETFASPAEAAAAHQGAHLADGHMSCGAKVIGPFNTVTDSLALLSTAFSDLAAGSVVSSANDLAIFSHFLLSSGRDLFKSSTLVQEITTGHTVLDNMVVVGTDAADAFGFAYNPDGNVIAAGYGIDVVGNVMFGYDFFTKNGDTATFKQRNGFVPSERLGVVLAANTGAKAPPGSAPYFLLDRIRSYVLGIFLDVPQPQLDAMWNQAIRRANQLQPDGVGDCDAHFFQGVPWEVDGLVISPTTQAKLVGSYVAVTSPGFYDYLKLTRQSDQLVLHYGMYAHKLIATADPDTFIWDVEIAGRSLTVQVSEVDTLLFLGVSFVRNA
ncbi:hypothetical protein DYB31_012956 [Aphanomyces astaci]|uniref:Beta-lactamase-related domain-containing protein n=1 Tax=Aphanomyces astaci TaxID=112090 RepID=A0A397FFE5_APHAT|nr:hypothetical protein DYB31_012956 [Aphanomyces astaci]